MGLSGKHRPARDDIEVGVISHVGMVRSENQDYYSFFEPEVEPELVTKGRLLVVCDGMGGHNGGTVASRTTVEAIVESFSKSATRNQKRLLSTAIDHANQAVRDRGARDITLRNMGTTCVAVAVRGGRAQIAHIGDSRCYLVRGGKIERMTRDHTYLNDLIEIGLLTPEKAKNHPERNIITRCVGMGDVLRVDFAVKEVNPGDVFLLCSDGLYNHVEDHEMLEHAQALEPQAACQKLVDLANMRGGEDNITVGILKVVKIADVFQASPTDDVDDPTPESPTPVMTVEPDADSTPKTATPITGLRPDLTTQQSITAIAPPRQAFSTRPWLILIAVEIAILILLRVLIARY